MGLKLSVVIPFHDEEGCAAGVVDELRGALAAAAVPYELILVDDNSADATPAILDDAARRDPAARVIHRSGNNGFGRAIRDGLEAAGGDAIAVYMGDGSDVPGDLVRCFRTMEERGVDCVFGSRFTPQSTIGGYPVFKRVCNRLGNQLIRLLFFVGHNDITNAFKLYRSSVIRAVMPLQSTSFEITAELPLSAIVAGYSYAKVPISWRGREKGVSKYRIMVVAAQYLRVMGRLWGKRTRQLLS